MTAAAPTPTSTPASSLATCPLRLGPPEAFAAARALFERARYDEVTVAERMGGTMLFGFSRLGDGRKTLAGPPEDANAALVRLLVDSEPLPAADAEALCGADAIRALRALGVLVPDANDGALLRPTVALVPLQGVWLACDIPPSRRRLDPSVDGTDLVFPPMTDLTREFLEVIADAPGLRVLELCAGSGVAALRAMRRGAAEGWATDLTPRSVQFARFNAALNGFDAVTVVESDVWEALRGETFDRVYAHPPYVPALQHEFDYRDAGGDGEHVTRRIVEGLGAHLRPGGRCSMTCGITDRRDAPVEKRLRDWLGEAAPEFDVLVLQRRDWDAMNAYRSITHGGEGFRDCERWLRHFDDLAVDRFLLCSIELRRDARGRAPVTERRRVSKRVDAAAADWLLAWRRRLAGTHALRERLTGLRPTVVPGTDLEVALVADAEGGWRTVGATVTTAYPSLAAVKAPPVAPTLLELCDGTRDVPALLAGLRDAGLVEDDVGEEEVGALVELLLTAGALEVPELPVPRPPAPSRPVPAQDARTTDSSSVPTQSTSA